MAEKITETFEKLLDNKKYNSIKDVLTAMNPADIALVLEDMPEQKLPLLFRLLPKEIAADAFVEMDGDLQELLIQSFTDKELKAIVDELYLDDAVDLVEEMPANMVKRILKQADPNTRQLINEMLKYPDDSAGSIMTTEFVDLSKEMTPKQAIDKIRIDGIDKETINVCYILDKKRKLLGCVSIRSIILAPEESTLSDIMEENVISVGTLEDQEEVAQMFSKYDLTAMPVVDTEGRMVGIVTVDDAIDVMTEEGTEDISKMAAITPVDKPYLKRSTIEIWKSRIPWLMFLMISATFTSLIINHFEASLSACISLTAFIPMLMGTGGNSGSQSSVTVIRSMSLDEVELPDFLSVLWKEVRVAVLCGISLAAVNFLKLLLLDKMSVLVSLVVSLSLAAIVLVAKSIGSMLPFLAQKVGFDPAVMASPFISTIVDSLSLLIYFSFATLLLGI